MIAEAEFTNQQGDDWDYGFAIRNPGRNRVEVIGLTHQQWWFHNTRNSNDDDYTDVDSGFLWESRAALRNKNHLVLLAFGESGWFFLNDTLVAELDLGHNQDHGEVKAMGGYFEDSRDSPTFENFNVWVP